MKKMIVAFIIIIAIGCENYDEQNNYLSNFLDSHELIKIDSLILKDDGTNIFGALNESAAWKNNIILSDNITNMVWVFDSKLELKKRIGGKGRGPREFSSSPNILLSEDRVELIDHRSKKIDLYDESFNFISSRKFPADLIIQPRNWISNSNRYILWGIKPISSKQLSDLPTLLVLDREMNFVENHFYWDEKLKTKTAYGILNNYLNLSTGSNSTYYSIQGDLLEKIHHYNADNSLLKIFGMKPNAYKNPPDVNIEKILRSMDATIKYRSSITTVCNVEYDAIHNYLYCNYVNYREEASYQRSYLLGEHYLQIYNKNYDCIFDGPINGSLQFINNGHIYILVSEEPNNLVFEIYKIEKK